MASSQVAELAEEWEQRPGHVCGIRIRETVAKWIAPAVFRDGVVFPNHSLSEDGIYGLLVLQTASYALDATQANFDGIVADTLHLISQELSHDSLMKFIKSLSELGTSAEMRNRIACSRGVAAVMLEDHDARLDYCASWVSVAVMKGRNTEAVELCVAFSLYGAGKRIMKQLMFHLPAPKSDLIDRSSEGSCFLSVRKLLGRYARITWNCLKKASELGDLSEELTCPYATSADPADFYNGTHPCLQGNIAKMSRAALLEHLQAVHPNYGEDVRDECRFCDYPFLHEVAYASRLLMQLQHFTECAKGRKQCWIAPPGQRSIAPEVSMERRCYLLPGEGSAFRARNLRWLKQDGVGMDKSHVSVGAPHCIRGGPKNSRNLYIEVYRTEV